MKLKPARNSGMMLRNIAAIPALVALTALMSCYSFRGGSAPAHLSTIYIMQVEDNSGFGRASIRDEMMQELVGKFRDDNSLRVVDDPACDSRLEVVITRVGNDERLSVSAAEFETERAVVIEARATFFDNVKRRPIFENRSFIARSQYPIGQASAEADAFEIVIDKVTRDILLESVANW